MKRLLTLLLVLLISASVPTFLPEASAQLKTDPVKAPSKLSLWLAGAKEKCEKAMEWVSNSQMGQFVGDGIKYAKEGIKFAKEQYEAAMDLYNKTKDSVLNSKEYKAAMVSKDIATETARLKKIQEERKQKLEEIEQQQSLVQEQSQAKISNVRSNLELNEQRLLQEEAETGGLNSEAQSFMSEQDRALEEIERDTASQIENLQFSAQALEEEYKEKLLDQSEKIADLTLKLNDIMKGDGKGTTETRSARELIQEQQDKLFKKAEEKVNLAIEKRKKKNRNKEMHGSIDESLRVAMDEGKQKQSTYLDKVDSKAGVADTMTGESEVSGVNTEVLSEQLSIMMSYIRLNLAHIKMQAITEINMIPGLEASAATDKFDICEYTDPENRKSALQMAKDKAQGLVDKVSDAYQKGKEKIEDATEKYNEVKDKIDEAKDTIEEGIEVGKELGSVTEGLADSIKSQATSSISGMF